MSVWEYKVISSGKGGFATPALLETFLNQLGKDEWEIIRYTPQPDNPLAFTGLARRPTQRDWTLQDAAAAAAKAEADKLRAEFEAKFKEGSGSSSEEKPESPVADKTEPAGDIRRLRDTESDQDPEADDEAGEPDEWDKLSTDDQLPTFFEAIRPHMRRNQRGPGLSVGVDHLAKKWELSEKEVLGALKDCGFVIPDDEDADPAYLEYDGDLYWVNVNRRGELWINTKEKSRPMFRVVAGAPVAPEAGAPAEGAAPAGEAGEGSAEPRERGSRNRRDRRGDRQDAEAPAQAGRPPPLEPGQPLPTGPELLDRLAPMMRRSRRGRGISGSISFLARALKLADADLITAFNGLGLVVPSGPEDRPPPLEIGDRVWWLNHDQRGGLWINGDEKKAAGSAATDESASPGAASESAPSEGASGDDTQAAGAPDAPESDAGGPTPSASESAAPVAVAAASAAPLAAVRLLLNPTKTGGFAAEICNLAETLGRNAEEFLATLVSTGLKVPEKPREKPVFVEHNGEIFWLNRNAKDEIWLNAKASKFADDDGEKSRSRSRRKADEDPA